MRLGDKKDSKRGRDPDGWIQRAMQRERERKEKKMQKERVTGREMEIERLKEIILPNPLLSRYLLFSMSLFFSYCIVCFLFLCSIFP